MNPESRSSPKEDVTLLNGHGNGSNGLSCGVGSNGHSGGSNGHGSRANGHGGGSNDHGGGSNGHSGGSNGHGNRANGHSGLGSELTGVDETDLTDIGKNTYLKSRQISECVIFISSNNFR